MDSDCELIHQLKRLDDAVEIDLPEEVVSLLDDVFTSDGPVEKLTSTQRKFARQIMRRYEARLERLGK